MKTIGEALADVMACASPFVPVGRALSLSLGTFAVRDVVATVPIPSFPASTVDGYAVRASEIAAGVRLPVFAESRAGGPTPISLALGTTARIFTGAPVPTGADAVVMQEVVSREGDVAVFERAIAAGTNIRAPGSDIATGDVIVRATTEIDSGAIAAIASQGGVSTSITRRPRVGIVTTGDEVVTTASVDLAYGAIHDVNGPMLTALVRQAGGELSRCDHTADALEPTRAAIERAVLGSDVVVVAGGVSVGDHDFVHAALAALGVEQRLWKVRMKPGKPFTLGVRGRVPILGLPGNPVSAWVGFEVFVRPLLRRLLGDPRPYRRVGEVVLGASVRCSADRTELARARLDDDGVAWPFAKQGSAALTSITGVDALLVLPERAGELAAGDRVRALLLDGRGSATPPFT